MQYEVEHLQELIPQEPEEDPEDVEGMSSVEDNYIVHVARLSRNLQVPHSLHRSSILSS
jgi:hypothetical protein